MVPCYRAWPKEISTGLGVVMADRLQRGWALGCLILVLCGSLTCCRSTATTGPWQPQTPVSAEFSPITRNLLAKWRRQQVESPESNPVKVDLIQASHIFKAKQDRLDAFALAEVHFARGV